jgi:hemolysin III
MLDEDGRPLHLVWRYNRAELLADGIVHVIGLTLTLCGAIVLLALCMPAGDTRKFLSACIYATSLVAALGVSAAYNLWPMTRTKWLLRRADHATIFLLIAGTYTPLLAAVADPLVSRVLLGAVWLVAVAGMTLKVALPGRFERVSILLYLALGWSGLFVIRPVMDALPPTALVLVVTAGVLYTTGLVFHLWESLRFQNAIWHGFVLVASACNYGAVLLSLAFTAA